MKTKVWAHRGASAYAPENSLESFELAIKHRADGIELDVQLTRDNNLVVIHDEKIDRVSNNAGYIRDYTLKELKSFSFNKKFPQYGKVAIPTLEEVYELIRPTCLTVNVELKNSIIQYEGMEEKLIELEKRMGMQNRIIYSSFNHYSLMTLKKVDSAAKIGILFADEFIDVPSYAVKIGADALHPALYILQLPDFIKNCKDKKLPLHVWTVNEEEHIKIMVENQIEAIITDRPDTARKIVDATSK